MGPHFVYEHLLTKAKATVRPNGIHVEGEVFNCDRLRELGYLVAAVANQVKLTVAYNPILASEVYFYDRERNTWTAAFNIDPEVYRLKFSFSEADNYRGWQESLTRQAAFNAHGRRRKRLPFVRQTIMNALKEKKETPFKTSVAKANIIENRAQERANQRTARLNGALPQPSELADKSSIVNTSDNSAKSSGTDKLKQLWSKIDATSKT
jgi:hypothetical protein